jgi:hypothetical protein
MRSGLYSRSVGGPLRRLRFVPIVALAAVSTFAGQARAYCRATTCDDEGSLCNPQQSTDCGDALRWRSRCVGFSVQEDASAQVTRTQARGIVRQAFEAWEQAACPGGGNPSIFSENLGYVPCERAEYNEAAGNANVVVFRDHFWPHPEGTHNIALTTVTFDTNTGEIFDADIEVNTEGYDLTVTDVTLDYDLLAVMTHEVGHFLGLAHSEDLDASMFAIYTQGSIDARSLSPDDVAAICAAYPPKEPVESCNPIPRHGFSPECAGSQTEGDCSVAEVTGAPAGTGDRGSASRPAAALVLLAAGCAILRARSATRRR